MAAGTTHRSRAGPTRRSRPGSRSSGPTWSASSRASRSGCTTGSGRRRGLPGAGSGEALLIVEGEERPLRQWDFVHCPPGTKHIVGGAGRGCASSSRRLARAHRRALQWGRVRRRRGPLRATALRLLDPEDLYASVSPRASRPRTGKAGRPAARRRPRSLPADRPATTNLPARARRSNRGSPGSRLDAALGLLCDEVEREAAGHGLERARVTCRCRVCHRRSHHRHDGDRRSPQRALASSCPRTMGAAYFRQIAQTVIRVASPSPAQPARQGLASVPERTRTYVPAGEARRFCTPTPTHSSRRSRRCDDLKPRGRPDRRSGQVR